MCSRCAGRLRRALVVLPGLVAWVRAQAEPSMAVSDEPMRKDAKKSPPVPVRLDAVDAADELHALLAAWCRAVVEEHPTTSRGPDLTGSVRARRVLADMTGPVVGLAGPGGRMSLTPPRVTEDRHVLTPGPGREGPVAVRYVRHRDEIDASGGWRGDSGTVSAVPPTEHAAAWLTAHLTWALGRAWAGELVDELADAVETAERRWPRDERPARLPTTCPACDRASLVRYAPTYPGAATVILCEAEACGELIREELYDFHAARVLAGAREAP